LQHPGFEFPVRETGDPLVSIVGKYIEPVETAQFGGAFDKFLLQELPAVPRATTMN